MRRLTLILALFLCGALLNAQDIAGTWNGLLEVGGQKLRLVFHVTEEADGLRASFDSPDQGAFDLPMRSAVFADGRLTLVSDAPPLEYSGEFAEGRIIGVFRQAGMEIPLDLIREEIAKPVYNRPQEPKEPYPYLAEEIRFENPKAGITLAGTLTLPEGKGVFPAAILVSGSGPQNRDEELLGHKPFLVLADHLTRNGIAVLRYDDRGFGESVGDFGSATTEDLASDARAAVEYLRTRPEISQIGLIGHSEGGVIAPLVASEQGVVDFIVMLAGTGIRGDRLLLLQAELIARATGESEDTIKQDLALSEAIYALLLKGGEPQEVSAEITAMIDKSLEEGTYTLPENTTREEHFRQTLDILTSPWIQWFLAYDPYPALTRVTCPVLALNGSLDLQVPPRENLEPIAKALAEGGNKDFTTREYPGLNHLFQECETGSPTEYAKIEQTIAPVVLEDISAWIRERFTH